MTQAPLKLILLHHYRQAQPAVDQSGFLCHGTCQNTVQLSDGAEAGSGALAFSSASSAVKVAPAPQWQNLQALIIDVRLRFDDTNGARRNIIEGDGCFALFADAAGYLHFDMYTRVEGQTTHAWNGVSTNANAVGQPFRVAGGKWLRLQASFDGLATARLWADGQLIAQRSDFSTSLGSSGAAGVTIGNWTLWNQYALHGAIDSIAVWKLDDWKLIRDFFARLDEAGHQAWVRFIACLHAAQGETATADFQQVLGLLLRRLSRLIASADPCLRDELLHLLNEYAALWSANRIARPAYRHALEALYCLLLKLGGTELAADFRRILAAFDATWGERAGRCFDHSGIRTHDAEWIKAFGPSDCGSTPPVSKEQC